METTLYKTEFGPLKVVSNGNKLLRLDFNPTDKFLNMPSEFNDSVIFQLEEYFARKRKTFDIPLDLSSNSPFNSRVWNELLNIPYGRKSAYKTIATKINKEKAYRAVGTAIGKNPIPIIVPCHRVLNTNGGLGGFSLGLDFKKKLLKIEQIDV